MIFNSVSYLLFFPIVTILYFAFPKKLRNAWLLIASYFFYMNWNAAYGLLLFGSTVITYLCSLLVEWAKEKKQSVRLAKDAMAASFLLNLGLLFYFKYLNFAIVNLNRISSLFHGRQLSAFDILLPVGISFYIFQALGYTMDVYRGKIKACRNFFRYALFVSFFPQLVAGPIERSDNLLPQFEEEHTFDTDRIREGLLWMLWGLFLKIVIADNLSVYITEIYDNYLAYTGAEIVFATVLFAFQIYCDFASYSMIAVGVGRLFGFELVQNFKQPYFAKNLTDFWRRWHISLSSWLRDYIYIPLGGGRKGLAVRQRNILLVFLISGLWHGGAPQFLAWGLLHGAGQVVQDFYKKAKQAVFGEAKIGLEKLRHMLSVLLTFFTVMCFWIFFRSESVSMAVICLKNMFTRWNGFLYWRQFLFTMGLEKTQFFIAIAGIAVLFGIDLISEKKKQEPAVWIYRMPLPVRWAICLFLIGAVFVVGQYGKGFDPSGFIYVEF